MSDMQQLAIYFAVLIIGYLIWTNRRRSSTRVPDNLMDPAYWEIGPFMGGESMSKGLPLNPSPHPEGWCIDIPYPDASAGHAHYVTVPVNNLIGKTKMTLKCRLEMADAVKLCPVKSPESPSLLTLYFQRRGDTYFEIHEAYRWFASFGTRMNLRSGNYILEAQFDQNWTAAATSSRESNPEGFQAAINDACRVGFVLGGGDGLGHGVYATGPARLVVTDFKIE